MEAVGRPSYGSSQSDWCLTKYTHVYPGELRAMAVLRSGQNDLTINTLTVAIGGLKILQRHPDG